MTQVNSLNINIGIEVKCCETCSCSVVMKPFHDAYDRLLNARMSLLKVGRYSPKLLHGIPVYGIVIPASRKEADSHECLVFRKIASIAR